jgi:transmembrane sensor
MLSEPAFKELLEKYINGQTTPAESEMVERWFDLIGENEQPVQLLSEMEKARLFAVMEQTERFREAASASMDSGPTVLPVSPVHTRGRLAIGKLSWKAAAMWGGLILLGWAGYKTARSAHKGTTPEMAMVEVSTGQGQVKRVWLPDSSEIWLNANTRLQYAADFAHDRRIRLNGEALFHITRDGLHPFTIETGDGLFTRVLGTEFDVESYSQMPVTTIAVISGKVQVSRLDSVLGVLTRRESIRYDRSARQFEKTPVENIDRLSGWVSGQWAFDNKSVADLRLLLKNQFGINIVNRLPALEKIRVSINFNAKQTPEEIVSLFSTFLDCHYRWKDKATMELY